MPDTESDEVHACTNNAENETPPDSLPPLISPEDNEWNKRALEIAAKKLRPRLRPTKVLVPQS
jgi:hypothetical protein